MHKALTFGDRVSGEGWKKKRTTEELTFHGYLEGLTCVPLSLQNKTVQMPSARGMGTNTARKKMARDVASKLPIREGADH